MKETTVVSTGVPEVDEGDGGRAGGGGVGGGVSGGSGVKDIISTMDCGAGGGGGGRSWRVLTQWPAMFWFQDQPQGWTVSHSRCT